MQVIVDTRHDTLEEALAVIRLAFARVEDDAPRRARAAAAHKTPAKKPAARPASATKRAPAKAAASRHDGKSNFAPPGQANAVRAWARAQGMQVKTAGRMPAAVISAYNAAHS